MSAIQKQLNTVVIFTDLEGDDTAAICLLVKLLVRCYFYFVVGEGSGVAHEKVQLVHVLMHTLGQQYDFLGYQVEAGAPSKKDYPPAYFLTNFSRFGIETFSIENLEKHEIRLAVMLKPPREFIGVEVARTKKAFGDNAILHMYGSFNIRTLLFEAEKKGENKDDTVLAIQNFISAFREVRWFETFPVIGQKNAINIETDPELCKQISLAQKPFAKAFKEVMGAWNKGIVESQRKKLQEMLSKVHVGKDIENAAEEEALIKSEAYKRTHKIIASIEAGMSSDGTLAPQMVLADVLIPFAIANQVVMKSVSLTGFSAEGYPVFEDNPESKLFVPEPGHEEENRKNLIQYLTDFFENDA